MADLIEVLIFDLGGVLVDFSAFDDLLPLLRQKIDPEEIRRRWIACPIIREFELGRVSPREFAAHFVKDWDVASSPEEFLVTFRSWSRNFFPGARSLLKLLKGKYRVAALSNSNATHWDRNVSELGILELFDAAFSSHELGYHKPDPRSYLEALVRLGVRADRSAFFDDSPSNVEGALNVGMRAFHVRGVLELQRCLVEQGLC